MPPPANSGRLYIGVSYIVAGSGARWLVAGARGPGFAFGKIAWTFNKMDAKGTAQGKVAESFTVGS